MAKELFIMFIYDTQRCQKEDDDPQDAVLYFHPTWVSDQQKLALCGQLMGATQFFLSAFSCPRVISLNSGKFVVQQFGQYILTVGTDRNIPDWILQHRADTLHSLLQFYHKDFDSISSKCAEDGSYFNEKLHQIFETYVPIIQYAGNIFGTIPTVKLPKSAGSVFLEALQILQCFQAKGVLGGTVLYQNKVVATQLSSDLTKRLISTDPYRIKWWRKGRASGAPALGLTFQGGVLPPNQPREPNLLREPCFLRAPIYQGVTIDQVHQPQALAGFMQQLYSTAESVVTPFHLPVGVQLLYVYVPNSEYKKLSQESSNMKSALQSAPLQKTPQRKIHQGKTTAGKEQMAMKRDTSRIFTVPEEEGELDDVHSEKLESVIVSQSSKNIPDLEAVSEIDSGSKTEDIDLVSKTSEIESSSKEEADSGIKVDEIDSGSKTEEISGMEFDRNLEIKTKTPLDDMNINRVLHAKVLSICCEGESDIKKGETKSISKKQAAKKLKSNLRGNRLGMKQAINYDRETHSSSLNDLYGSSRPAAKAIPIRCYSFGLPQITHEMCDEHANSEQEKVSAEKYFYNTIADPLHPCFRNDGLPISRSLFHDYVADHYDLLKTERSVDTSPIENTSESFPSVSETEGQNNDSIEQNNPKILSEPNAVENSIVSSREKDAVSFKQEVYRRSLSLPLKTTTSDGSNNAVNENEVATNSNKTSWDKFGALESPLAKPRQFSNLQLTPLMSKLSILAMEEKSSLPYSRETTPCDVRELYLPGRNGDKPSRRPSVCRSDTNDTNHTKINAVPETEKAVLYVCGQQNMALLLLLDEKLGQDPELIHFLWETSLSGLTQLETHLHHCLEHLPQGDGMEPYSYICLDPNWDMLQRGGSWGALELDVVSCLHYDFSRSSGLTEVVLRCDDSTVYGYQCGRTEVFYQQPVGSTPGLPTPADLMGTVPLKAKRRLERDHGIILL